MEKRYERISLLRAPLDGIEEASVDDKVWQPLELILLADFLIKNGHNRRNIQILDPAVDSNQAIEEKLIEFKPDLVGFSSNIATHRSALRLAETVKFHGADVVFGGHYITPLAANALRNRWMVDFVVRGDGEEALLNLVNGVDLYLIPNLVHRAQGRKRLTRAMVESVVSADQERALSDETKGQDLFVGNDSYVAKDGEIVINRKKLNPSATLTEPDYTVVNLLAYWENYVNSADPGRFKKPVTYMPIKGCHWRDMSDGGCVFCCLGDATRVDDVDLTINNIRNLNEQLGVDALQITSDDFLGGKHDKNGNPWWFSEWYRRMPEDLKRKVGINFAYARTNYIDAEVADMLKDLGTYRLFFGLESGDKRMLKNSTKGSHPEQQLRALELLKEREIQTISSFVLGLPGETEQSLANTFRHIEKIAKFDNGPVLAAVLATFRGSRAYRSGDVSGISLQGCV